MPASFAIPRRLIVCADDYGISPAVSLGIRQLAEQGRINATGVMAGMPSWPQEAEALRQLSETLGDRFQVGLHITLTDQTPLGDAQSFSESGHFPSIGAWIKHSLRGGVPMAAVAAEIDRQMKRFIRHFGRAPDFIDGHQHVHVLPGIRAVVLDLFGHAVDPSRCWLRDCGARPLALWRRGGGLKSAVVAALAWNFAIEAKQRGICVNHGFAGFYDAATHPLSARAEDMVAHLPDGGLLMIHPGHVDAELEAVDSLTAPRQQEWNFLNSDAWPTLLAKQEIVLARRDDLFSR